MDVTIITSASKSDSKARWIKHRNRGVMHGFKAPVGADANAALVEQVSVTPANAHDGHEGPAALPDAPGDVFANSAYRGQPFEAAVHARGGVPRVTATAMWGQDEAKTLARLDAWNAPIQRGHAHREDLRHLETLLRPATHAMARPRPSHRPGPLHRNRLQPQAKPRSPAGVSRGAEPAWPKWRQMAKHFTHVSTRHHKASAHRSHYVIIHGKLACVHSGRAWPPPIRLARHDARARSKRMAVPPMDRRARGGAGSRKRLHALMLDA
ncbi:hypothetical protein [Crenalkalicoccus roseus]